MGMAVSGKQGGDESLLLQMREDDIGFSPSMQE
jgi:hypothetical protein